MSPANGPPPGSPHATAPPRAASPAPDGPAVHPPFHPDPGHGSAAVASGAASVPTANRAVPELDQPAFTPQPRVYRTGSPPPTLPTRTPSGVPQEPAAPAAPRQRHPSAPVYGDLLHPAAPDSGASPQPGSPPPYPTMPPPGPVSPGAAPGTSAGMPGHEAPAPAVPQQRGGPAPDWGAPPDADAGEQTERSGPRTGLIVAVVLGSAAALVLLTLGVAAGLSWLSQPSGDETYQVGECVVQEGSEAKSADCGADGAFEIVSQVDSRDECPDPTQPTIEVGGDSPTFYCLASAAAGGEGDEPPAEGGEGSDGQDGSDGENGSDGEDSADGQ